MKRIILHLCVNFLGKKTESERERERKRERERERGFIAGLGGANVPIK